LAEKPETRYNYHSKRIHFKWNFDAQRDFDQFKKAVATASILPLAYFSTLLGAYFTIQTGHRSLKELFIQVIEMLE